MSPEALASLILGIAKAQDAIIRIISHNDPNAHRDIIGNLQDAAGIQPGKRYVPDPATLPAYILLQLQSSRPDVDGVLASIREALEEQPE